MWGLYGLGPGRVTRVDPNFRRLLPSGSSPRKLERLHKRCLARNGFRLWGLALQGLSDL